MPLPEAIARQRRRTAVLGVVLALLAVAVLWWAGRDGQVLGGLSTEDEAADPSVGWSQVDGVVRADLLAAAEVVNGDVPAELPRAVLVNLWATYCEPCRAEMPALAALDADDQLDVAVVGISLDKDVRWAREFQRDVGATFPNVLDPSSDLQEELSAITPVAWLPTTFLVVDGRATWVHLGPFDDLDDLRADVRRRLGDAGR